MHVLVRLPFLQETSAVSWEVVLFVTEGLGYERWMGPAAVVQLTPRGGPHGAPGLCCSTVALCTTGAGVPCKVRRGEVPLPKVKCGKCLDKMVPKVSATLNLSFHR